jgi:hypothetical protein
VSSGLQPGGALDCAVFQAAVLDSQDEYTTDKNIMAMRRTQKKRSEERFSKNENCCGY